MFKCNRYVKESERVNDKYCDGQMHVVLNKSPTMMCLAKKKQEKKDIVIIISYHVPVGGDLSEPTDEDSVIAGITAEDFDPLNSSFSSKLNSSMAAGFSAVNAAGSEVDGGLYGEEDEKRELQRDLLQHSQDSPNIPQLCDVNVTVKKVGLGAFLFFLCVVVVSF